MPFVAGPVARATIDGRSFAGAGESGPKIDLGGYVNTTRRMGSGALGITQEFTPWSITGLALAIAMGEDSAGFEFVRNIVSALGGGPGEEEQRGGLEFLRGVAQRGELVPCTIELVDGTVYQGAGTIQGPVVYDTMTGLVTLDLVGEGELSQQGSELGLGSLGGFL